MKTQEAIELVKEAMKIKEHTKVENLASLVLWAYDQGWEEGREDYREEEDTTEQQEWRKSR